MTTGYRVAPPPSFRRAPARLSSCSAGRGISRTGLDADPKERAGFVSIKRSTEGVHKVVTEYRLFGSTDVEISVIGQGTWYIEEGGRSATISALHRGLGLGMNHIDTEKCMDWALPRN